MQPEKLQVQLALLIQKFCLAEDVRSKAKLKQQIFVTMQQSEQIWRGPGVERSLYGEALQNNWLWFARVLATYDPSQATVMHWFNQYLKWEIKKLERERQVEQHRLRELDGEKMAGDPEADCDRAIDFQTRMQQLKACLARHQPKLRQRYMRQRTDISCDRIMAALLEKVEQAPSATVLSQVFAQLAQDWQLDRRAFRQFCTRSCFCLVRQLCPSNRIFTA